MCQCAIHVATRSAGSINSDWPMPYQLKICPPRPRSPNSGYSSSATCGCEVHSQCVVCKRYVVSAVPSSPDCTTKVSNPVTRHRRNNGSRNQRAKGEFIVMDGNTKQASDLRPRTPKRRAKPNSEGKQVRGLRSEVRGLRSAVRRLPPNARRLVYPVAGIFHE